jgi:hypothetical protein
MAIRGMLLGKVLAHTMGLGGSTVIPRNFGAHLAQLSGCVYLLRGSTIVMPIPGRFPHPQQNDPQLKAAAYIDNSAYDVEPIRSVGHLTDEGLVDFEGVERKLTEVAQAGVTRAEIVYGYPYSSCP